jgi:hypothetical protein
VERGHGHRRRPVPRQHHPLADHDGHAAGPDGPVRGVTRCSSDVQGR